MLFRSIICTLLIALAGAAAGQSPIAGTLQVSVKDPARRPIANAHGTLSGPGGGATITGGAATLTINDNDAFGQFVFSQPVFKDGVPFTLKAPYDLRRTSKYLTHPVFTSHHSETEMMRYIRSLERKDVVLDTSMIPLGSCTMKLNAAAEMLPVTWPGFSRMHPFAPRDQAQGFNKFVHATHRQNFVVPPRQHRSFPLADRVSARA